MSQVIACGTPEQHANAAIRGLHKSGGVAVGFTPRMCPACGTLFTAPIPRPEPRPQVVRTRNGTSYLATKQGWRKLREEPVQVENRS